MIERDEKYKKYNLLEFRPIASIVVNEDNKNLLRTKKKKEEFVDSIIVVLDKFIFELEQEKHEINDLIILVREKWEYTNEQLTEMFGNGYIEYNVLTNDEYENDNMEVANICNLFNDKYCDFDKKIIFVFSEYNSYIKNLVSSRKIVVGCNKKLNPRDNVRCGICVHKNKNSNRIFTYVGLKEHSKVIHNGGIEPINARW